MPATLLKRDFGKVIFLWILRALVNESFCETLVDLSENNFFIKFDRYLASTNHVNIKKQYFVYNTLF